MVDLEVKFRDYLLYCAGAVILFGSFPLATACRHPKGAIFVHTQKCFSLASLKLYQDGINNELEIPKQRYCRCLIAEVSLTVYYFYFHRIQRSLERIALQLIRSLPDHNVYSFRCLQNGSTPYCALNYWACPIHAP